MNTQEGFALAGAMFFMFGLGLATGNVEGYAGFMYAAGIITFFGEPILKRALRLTKEVTNVFS